MSTTETINPSTLAKWGWGTLLVISALVILDGVIWFFTGPNIIHARLVAICFVVMGAQALLVALEGYRNGTSWAWYVSWVLAAALATLGVIEVGMAESPYFGLGLLGSSGVTVVGLLLARRGLTSEG